MRKFILAMLVAACGVCLAFAAAACAPDIPMHNYSDKWRSNETQHWHPCTDSGCKAKSDVADHDWELTNKVFDGYKEPTCGKPGYGLYICSVCGADITMEIPPTENHTWQYVEGEELAATCGAEGFKNRRCTECGTLDREVIPPTGLHEFGTEYFDVDSSVVGVEGGHYHVCSVCRAHSEPETHVAGNPVTSPSMDPARLTDGKATTYCRFCKHVMAEETIYAPGVPVYFEIQMTTDGKPRDVTNSGDSANVSSPVGKHTLWYMNLKDRNGNSINSLPSAVKVRITYKADRGDIVLNLNSTPSFSDGKYTLVTDDVNLPLGKELHFVVELYTGEGDNETVRATRHLYLTLRK